MTLHAPLAGWVSALDQVPDPVFAGGMAGDGIAIDPTAGVLHAPCDGEVVLAGAARHALSIRSATGIEVLMHVGIDTVALRGEGFALDVEAGQRVRTGQPLLRFDLDLLARRAPSLLTPVLIASGGSVQRRQLDRAVAVGDWLLEVVVAVPADAAASATATRLRRRYRIPFDHGLHARPASQVVGALRPFTATLTLHARGRRADPRSTVALMALGLQRGDEAEIEACGVDAAAALDSLADLLMPVVDDATAGTASVRVTDGLRPVERDARLAASADAGQAAPAQSAAERAALPQRLPAVVASPGLALGRAVQLHEPEPAIDDCGRGFDTEQHALQAALANVTSHLERLIDAAAGEQAAVLEAHVALCQDPELTRLAEAVLHDGHCAAQAWRHAIRTTSDALAALGDPRMLARTADLRDLERQVLRALAGQPPITAHALPEQAILLADELLPSQLASLDSGRVAGICMAGGGATSHVALLAMARGIPLLIGVGADLLRIDDGAWLLLDGERGCLNIAPDDDECAAVRQALQQRSQRHAVEFAAARQPCRTRDGVAIAVLANIGAVDEAAAAVASGAEGCGLLRTEFLFMDRRQPPDEHEQSADYAAIAAALAPYPLTIRTLDLGGDKPIAYLTPPREDNPALGMRGIRVDRLQPALLRTQLRAILRLPTPERLRIMLPMVTELAELRSVRRLLADCAAQLGVTTLPQLGVMIETPAAALLADQLASEADFFSIGSNDLAQYTLAMDRQHPLLASRLDGLHPSVLRLIAQVAQAARAAGRPLAVCGGLASDPIAVPLLIGLGVHTLSVVPALIPRIKQTVRELDAAGCAALATAALTLSCAQAVRESVLREPAAQDAHAVMEAR